jgi:hypothetical protein
MMFLRLGEERPQSSPVSELQKFIYRSRSKGIIESKPIWKAGVPQYLIYLWFGLASRDVPDVIFLTCVFRKIEVVFDVREGLLANYACFEDSRKLLGNIC